MAATIQEPTQKQACAKCGQPETNLYAFHFGKKVAQTSRRVGNSTVHTTHYDVAGQLAAAACDQCVRSRRVFRLVVFGLMFIVGAGVALWASQWSTFKGPLEVRQMAQLQMATGTVAGIIGLIGLYGLLKNLFSGKTTHAENLIIAHKKRELRKLGFNTFWNTRSFGKLKRR